MSHGIGWFMLAVAILLVAANRSRPATKLASRGCYGLALGIALGGLTRLTDLSRPIEVALLVTQLGVLLAAIWFLVLAFRNGELPTMRRRRP